MTAIDFRTDPVSVRRQPIASLATQAADIPGIVLADSQPSGGYLRFKNDRGVPEICIRVREFKCIGESPPQDHPHVYINMGEKDTILGPYCGTRFRFDPRLGPFDAEPPDSLFADQTAA